MYIGLHVKCPLCVSDFNETWIFGSDFRNILKCQISRRSVQWKSSFSTRTAVQTCRSLWSLFTVLQPRLKLFGRTVNCVVRGAIAFIKFMYKKFMVLAVPCLEEQPNSLIFPALLISVCYSVTNFKCPCDATG